MNVYEVTITRPWDGRETISIHMTRKGALQIACAEALELLLECSDEDEEVAWLEDNLETLYNPVHTLKIKELDLIFNKCEQLLWNLETEIEVLEYTLRP